MKKQIIDYFTKSNKAYVTLIVLVLLGLFGFTISNFLAKSPTEGFSREVWISDVAMGEVQNTHSHIETIKIAEDRALIFAVDGNKTRLITINEFGKSVDNRELNLDLFYASEIAIDILSKDILDIYYLSNDLHHVVLNLKDLSFEDILLVEEVDSFKYKNEQLVYEQENGLYIMDISEPSKSILLKEGKVKSFTFEVNDESHVVVTMKNGIAVDILYLVVNKDLEVIRHFMLKENTGSSYLKTVRDIVVDKELATVLYVWSDNKFGSNFTTIQQVDTKTGELVTDYREEFSLHKSKFTIVDVEGSTVDLLLQENVHSGVNIVLATINEESILEIKPLTKTRKLSMLSSYFKFDEDVALVFFDINEGKKSIYFATSNPVVVESTSKATSIDPIRILGLIFLVFFQAAFLGAVVYLLLIALVPFLLLLIMNKFLPKFPYKLYIQSAISALIQTLAKLYMTYYIIHNMGEYKLTPYLIGEEPYIYVVLILMSVISYILMARYISWNKDYQSTASQSYLQFIFFEYIQYTLIVFIYNSTYLIISKI